MTLRRVAPYRPPDDSLRRRAILDAAANPGPCCGNHPVATFGLIGTNRTALNLAKTGIIIIFDLDGRIEEIRTFVNVLAIHIERTK